MGAMRNSTLSATDDALTEAIIGAALKVHKALGPGLLEGLYQKALVVELEEAGLTVRREVVIPVLYRGRPLGEQRLDLIVSGKVVLELKAVETLAPVYRAQLLTYLKISGLPIGLLINFGATHLQVRRLVNTPTTPFSVPPTLRSSVLRPNLDGEKMPS